MTAYRWEAVDAQGRVRRGQVDAASARAARDRLRADGLTPTAVDATAARGDPLAHVRLPPEQVSLLTRQLATLAQSGMPLDQALGAVAEQADDARAVKIVRALRDHIATGESLPAAMARFPRTFPPLYRGLVGAGSESGRLPDVLARLADYLEARAVLRQKFTSALIYPMLVTLIALGVIAVLLTYVVPQVVAVYQQSRQTLPWLTRALIATSEFFRATGWFWLGALAAALVAFIVADRRPGFRARWHAGAAAPARHRTPGAEPRDRALREHARHPGRQRNAAAAFAGGGERRRAHDSAGARGRRGERAGPRGRIAVPRAQGADASSRRC